MKEGGKLPVDIDSGRAITDLLDGRLLVLISGSPRRIEILRESGVPFKQITGSLREPAPNGVPPESYAVESAGAKIAPFIGQPWRKGTVLLGADTIVIRGRAIMGKPADREDAMKILKALSGIEHVVITGLCLHDIDSGRKVQGCETSRVRFRALTEEQIRNYVDTGEPMDKAGAYGIQGMGSILVESFEGPLDNIVGLPMKRLHGLLRELLAG